MFHLKMGLHTLNAECTSYIFVPFFRFVTLRRESDLMVGVYGF
jgi:hypothetical protein